MLTFIIGVGIVWVWQSFTGAGTCFMPAPPNLQSTEQVIHTTEQIPNKQQSEPDFCEEIKKNPSSPRQTPGQLKIVSGGVLNQRVCKPLPYREIDKSKDYTKEFVVVQVTVDQNGFVQSAGVVTPQNNFARRFERVAKRLRIRPTILSGKNFKCSGVLIFYPGEDYSNW